VLCPLPFVLRAELAQKGHHRAPVGEGRLNQVERHESGEQKLVGAEEITEQHCEQDEKARDQSQITFDGHWRNRPPCCSGIAITIPATRAPNFTAHSMIRRLHSCKIPQLCECNCAFFTRYEPRLKAPGPSCFGSNTPKTRLLWDACFDDARAVKERDRLALLLLN